MKNFRFEPRVRDDDRFAEGKRFGFYLICAMNSYGFALVTAGVLIFRRSIDFDMNLIVAVGISLGVIFLFFMYFGVIRKRMIVIPILRVWTIGFLTLQCLVLVVALAVWLHYGVHNPALAGADSAMAAGLSLIGLFFGVFGLVRGIRHRWFEALLLPR
ncbi:hypothetical protein AruPA_02030 [Acidiphilium sp. PA]|uniref:hypothetical protein n=1 Tax=Acidiphilium sp. PA TaxID=2871705 RepID=UPI002244091A|nr:hypothetical protein [Acidiphilium sp. PA]MCW8305803.1 hypothetical protein [Acidiphilium sp. PA]